MFINQLLANNFTFNGVKYYKNSIQFSLFGKELEITFYAIAIVLGILTCFFLARPLCKKQGLEPDVLLDYMIAIIPLSIICARLWYVINDINSFHTFYDVIDIRSGGLAIYGGVMGGALAIFIVCKIKKIPFIKIADIGATMLPIGQAIGRWGNFFNQEVYGLKTSLHFPFGVFIESEQEWRVALFFVEGLLNTILFIVLYTYFLKGKKKDGYSMCFYFLGYGAIRGILEPLRDAEYNLVVFGIRSQIATAILCVSLGIIFLIVFLLRDGYIQKFIQKIKEKTSKGENENEE